MLLLVAANVDVDVDISSLGINVIIGICGVEEIEVWRFVRSNTV